MNLKANEKYTDKENEILLEISNFCENDCGNNLNCSEEDCVLFRIESKLK